MRLDAAVLCRSAAGALCALCIGHAAAHAQSDAVLKVISPNSVKLDKLGTVTLAGSYTPKRLPGCFAYDPAAALRRALPPKTVVEVSPFAGKGSTTLAWVTRAKDGQLVQAQLVEGGWAEASTRASTGGDVGDDPRVASLRDLQSAAKQRRVGLWVDCEAQEGSGAASGVDFEAQFEPLRGSEFEYGRVAPSAIVTAAATSVPLDDPGDSKNCGDFEFFEDAKQWFDRYYPAFGDVAKLDADNDGVPCPGLPHTPRRELYQPKQPRLPAGG